MSQNIGWKIATFWPTKIWIIGVKKVISIGLFFGFFYAFSYILVLHYEKMKEGFVSSISLGL